MPNGLVNVPASFHSAAMQTDSLQPAAIANALLFATPGWARIGLTAPSEQMREKAAKELALSITEALTGGPASTTISWRFRSDVGANTRLDSLHHLVKHKANLRVTCVCGKQHVYDAARFCRYAMCRNWNTQLEALSHHIKCDRCGRRGPRLKAVPDAPTPADPFPRSEDEWKVLVKRMRD